MEKTGSVRELCLFGDGVLRWKAEPVTNIGEDIGVLAADLVATMEKYGGIGLAAPQVGESVRVIAFCVNLDTNERGEPRVLINPEIIETDAVQKCQEACLSVPMVAYEVERPSWVKVRGLDENGNEVVVTATGLGASVLCHEIDHLDGVLFIDKLSSLRRDIATRKVKKFLKMYRRVAK